MDRRFTGIGQPAFNSNKKRRSSTTEEPSEHSLRKMPLENSNGLKYAALNLDAT
jgi:hypothetical protein